MPEAKRVTMPQPRTKARRFRRPPPRRYPLSIDKILAWADEHHQRTGRWPSTKSGRVRLDPSLTWLDVHGVLKLGCQGMPGGSSLAPLLETHRGVRDLSNLPPLSIEQVLAWADAHRARSGEWPTLNSGPIEGSGGETWKGVNAALRLSHRGLSGCPSVAKLLAKHRGVRRPRALPRLTVKRILQWADAHYERTGQWPSVTAGDIPEAPGENWSAVDQSLRHGHRGLRDRSSLAELLKQHRGVRNSRTLPPLSIEQILAWADAHRQRADRWPTVTSGAIEEAPGETWEAVDQALRQGFRGLPGGTSLARVLQKRRGMRNRGTLPCLSLPQILRWADAHYDRTGKWPRSRSGPIPEAPGETWQMISSALNGGWRGLPQGLSLNAVLAEHRGMPKKVRFEELSVDQIVAWARQHRRRTGKWPTVASGPVNGQSGPNWRALDLALRRGYHGLPCGSSLQRLLVENEGKGRTPQLTVKQILAWARAHHGRTGIWPNNRSGEVRGAPGENWAAIHLALSRGGRGLPGGASLKRLLEEHGCAASGGQKRGK
jgi:hypothetical protein